MFTVGLRGATAASGNGGGGCGRRSSRLSVTGWSFQKTVDESEKHVTGRAESGLTMGGPEQQWEPSAPTGDKYPEANMHISVTIMMRQL